LFISDSGNHRVLYWKEVPTENGQPADMVLGQSSLTEGVVNRGGDEASHCTLDDPYGLLLIDEEEEEEGFREIPMADDDDDDNEETALVEGEGESEEEEPKEPQPKFRLFICDRGNSRIVVWNELPYPKEEEVEEEFEELRVDDENSLIGEEEDEDDLEEEEEVPPGEPLSA
jgi:hypothetical protein